MAAEGLIGLDIGSMSVRAAETRRVKAGQGITNFGLEPLPEGAVKGGIIHDDKAVTQAVKQLWAHTKFRGRRVVLGVANRQVVVREMSMPNLPDKELRRNLAYEVRQVLPLAVEQSVIDFYPLEDPGQNKTVRGLLVAAPKDAVLAAVHATEEAGLHVARVDLASFALLRAAARLDSQVEAIVDIGAYGTTVVVHSDGAPLIVRTIPRGGAEITEMIATRLGTATGEAEAIKCRVGLHSDSEDESAKVIREAVRPLINEIRSSFDYLTASSQSTQQTQVRRLALSGGGSLLPGLISTLHDHLGIEVLAADPLLRLRDQRRGKHDSLTQYRASAMVSIGLAMAAPR